MSPKGLVLSGIVAISPVAHADEPNGRSGVAYGIAGAELALAGTIAIHSFTASSPGEGIGLAVNFLPLIVGVGAGLLGNDLDPRPALGFHGAAIGGLSMLAIGASFDGRDEDNGAALGPLALSLGVLGAAGSAYLGVTQIDDQADAIAITAAPLVGLAAGGLSFAIAHFIDDQGPKSTGRLLRYAGAGMLLGTVGGYSYAIAF